MHESTVMMMLIAVQKCYSAFISWRHDVVTISSLLAVDSADKKQWCWALMTILLLAWVSFWINWRFAGY